MKKVALLFLILCSVVNAAQNGAPESATLEGVVINAANGSPIPDATVTTMPGGITTTTNASGKFHLSDLRPGSVELLNGAVIVGVNLRAEKAGFVRPSSSGFLTTVPL